MKLESQASCANATTPLWLNANRYGLSSLRSENGYFRTALSRDIKNDSTRRWGIGYGLDIAEAYHCTSKTVLQQFYVQMRWYDVTLSVGSKERSMEFKNNALSSGSQTLGINARPVPQVRLAVEDYWSVPGFSNWLKVKGHLAYGKMTDDSWQHSFTQCKSKYSDDVLYHSKAGYMKIGKDGKPLSVELGIEMAATFGGTSYLNNADGTMTQIQGESGLRGYWHVFFPSGAEPLEDMHKNTAGNQVGSWLIRVNMDKEDYTMSVYADKFFEDHSAMFFLDYDGYGSGSEWNKKKKNRFVLYDFRDIMLGLEINLKKCNIINNAVFEYIYSKYQSGSLYHDHSPLISDHVGGADNYYSHYIYTGWQHWGQVIGNPLYRSPLYNHDGVIDVMNSRFKALHFAFSGQPIGSLYYRVRLTWQEGLGSYLHPYTSKHYNVSLGADATYTFPHNWSTTLSYGFDSGYILGHNRGAQLTVKKIINY